MLRRLGFSSRPDADVFFIQKSRSYCRVFVRSRLHVFALQNFTKYKSTRKKRKNFHSVLVLIEFGSRFFTTVSRIPKSDHGLAMAQKIEKFYNRRCVTLKKKIIREIKIDDFFFQVKSV